MLAISIMLENSQIREKPYVRYLGIYIDENLKWYTAHVISLVSKNLGIMRGAKYILSSRELPILYNALILPHLNYGAVIWGNNYDSNIKRKVMLQKRALRIIDKKPHLYPSNDLFIKQNVLKFKDMVKEQSIMIILAFVNNALPNPIAGMFKREPETNTRHSKYFCIPFASRSYILIALSCRAPRNWNQLIASKIQDIENVSKNKIALKKQTRKYFFEEYKNIIFLNYHKKSRPCRTSLPRIFPYMVYFCLLFSVNICDLL